jgi:hypothetical protein
MKAEEIILTRRMSIRLLLNGAPRTANPVNK